MQDAASRMEYKKGGSYGNATNWLVIAWMVAVGAWPNLAQANGRATLTMERYGEIRVGMNVDEAYKLLRAGPAEKFEPRNPTEDDCDYYRPRRGLAFMTNKRTIVRIEVSEDIALTPSGIRVGDPMSSVKAAFGDRVTDEPQFYDGPEARTLTVLSRDRKTAMRFEIYDNRVKEIYAGYEAGIHFAAGCW